MRQHQHSGLSTVTYLFSGAMMHRDSLVITRLKQASEDWKEKRFGLVPGETEYIPLPDSLS